MFPFLASTTYIYISCGFFFKQVLQYNFKWCGIVLEASFKWHGDSKYMFYILIMITEIRKKYTKFHHTEDFENHVLTYHLSVYKLQKIPENAHVYKPSCFGHWFSCHVIAITV